MSIALLCHRAERGRARRVAEALGLLCFLSVTDLCFTIWAYTFTPFYELNPLARRLLAHGQVAPLVLAKLSLTTAGVAIFWRLRGHGHAELTLWGLVVVYVLLAMRWSDYTTMIANLAAGLAT